MIVALLPILATSAPEPSTFGELQWLLDFLKAGGPLSLAILCGYWAWKKDREAKAIRDEHDTATRAAYEQLVAITNAQTAAMTKLQSTIDVLRELFIAVRRGREGPG